jgi:hypothetical protein
MGAEIFPDIKVRCFNLGKPCCQQTLNADGNHQMTRLLIIITIVFAACKAPTKKAVVSSMPLPDSVQVKTSPAVSLSDTTIDEYAGHHHSLDSLFLLKKDSSSFSSQDFFSSLLIGNLFSKEYKDAVLMYKINDSVSNMCVLRHSANKWDTLLSSQIFPVDIEGEDELIELADFNGDNIPDLKVMKQFWQIHTGERSDLWLYQNNHLIKVDGFDSIVSPIYDEATKLIYSYQSEGCADMSMYFGIFKIVGNKTRAVKEMDCDCCSEKSDSCTIAVYKKKSFRVPLNKAYKYVPGIYSDAIKEKCKME